MNSRVMRGKDLITRETFGRQTFGRETFLAGDFWAFSEVAWPHDQDA